MSPDNDRWSKCCSWKLCNSSSAVRSRDCEAIQAGSLFVGENCEGALRRTLGVVDRLGSQVRVGLADGARLQKVVADLR